MTPAQTLSAARDLLANGTAWSQGCAARDSDGHPMPDQAPGYGSPAKRCVLAAVAHVTGGLGTPEGKAAHAELRRRVKGDVARWNDDPRTSWDEVSRVLGGAS